MTKKIQKSMLFLVIVSVLLFSVGTSFLFYDTQKNQAIDVVKSQSAILKTNYSELRESDYDKLNAVVTQSRISVIDESGTVIFDNKTALDKLDNHNNRQEVIEARASGIGEEERYSDSFLDMYYYYAIMLENGLILRVSMSIDSFYSHIYRMFPFTIIALIIIGLIAAYISRKLTKNIIEPIEKADLKSNLMSPYVELDVYFNTMREQKLEIERQIERVNKRKETINTILNTMQEGFMIVDETHNVFLANQAFLRLMNLESYEIGDSVYRFVNDRNLLVKIDQALNGKSSNYQSEIHGSLYQVYISHTRILDEDVAILLFVDISLESENQKHREQFSANVSHELKTPLTSIKGLAELQANNMVASEDVVLFGEKILKQSDRLLELIDHIIRLSQFDEDLVDVEENIINFQELSNEVISHLQKNLDEKEIQLEVDVDDISFVANYNMFDELLYNLLENAIKYNNQNGFVSLSIKEDKDIIITVKNSGEKIENHDIPHLFERFYRVDDSRNKKRGGTGLGLSIVKHIVMHYKGSVEVNSDEITSFTIRIPRRKTLD